jgi:hypothetical protein
MKNPFSITSNALAKAVLSKTERPLRHRGIGYLYLTTLTSPKTNAKRFYTGLHIGSEFSPTYVGSGLIVRRFKQKYGRKCIKTERVLWARSKTELDLFESVAVEHLRKRIPENCVNIRDGGGSRGAIAPETKIKIGLANAGRPSHNKGKSWPASRDHEKEASAVKVAERRDAINKRVEAKRQLREDTLRKKEIERHVRYFNKLASRKLRHERRVVWEAGREQRWEEGKKKRSVSLMGHSVSEEARKAIGDGHRGKPGHTLNRGLVRTEEVKQKLRDAWVRRKAKLAGNKHFTK